MSMPDRSVSNTDILVALVPNVAKVPLGTLSTYLGIQELCLLLRSLLRR